MKKLPKIIMCLALILVLLPVNVRAGEQKVLSTSCDVAEYIFAGYYHCDTGTNTDTKGPIHIVKAILRKNNVDTPVYLVGLSGTEFIFNQATGIITDLQVGFEQDNFYIREVVDTLLEEVPRNSNVIFAGHSLGGMMAQQASGNFILKSNYNILNVITMGSPLINPIGREGTIKRLGDTADIVPFLSVHSVFLPFWQLAGLNRENGGYGRDFATAHMQSYLRDDVWGDYDALGFDGGNATITYDEDDVESFGASILHILEGIPTIDMSFWN